jgi:hypothetical protein
MVIGTVGWTWRSASVMVAVWCGCLAVARVESIRVPAGWWFLLLCAVIIGVLAIAWTRYAVAGAAALAIFVLAAQIFSPSYNPFAYHRFNLDPDYDAIFFNSHTSATDNFERSIWFERQLDTLPDDAGLYMFGTGHAMAVLGIYGVHVTGRWITPDEGGLFPQEMVDAAAAGALPRVVLYGYPDVVDDAVERLSAAAGAQVLMRTTEPVDDRYELAVLEIPPLDQR